MTEEELQIKFNPKTILIPNANKNRLEYLSNKINNNTESIYHWRMKIYFSWYYNNNDENIYIYIERSENKGASKVENFAEAAGKFVFSRTNKKS